MSFLELAVKNWKSTVAGILNPIIAMGAAGLFAPNPWISTKTAAGLLWISSAARIFVGLVQTDGIQIPGGSKVSQTTTVETPKHD
jgi:hypothetical protein